MKSGNPKSLAPLEEMRNVLVSLRSKVFFTAQGEKWAVVQAGRKSGITSDQRTGCVVIEMPDIRSASRLVTFSLFCLPGISLFIVPTDFPTCIATVADRSTMCGRALKEMARNSVADYCRNLVILRE